MGYLKSFGPYFRLNRPMPPRSSSSLPHLPCHCERIALQRAWQSPPFVSRSSSIATLSPLGEVSRREIRRTYLERSRGIWGAFVPRTAQHPRRKSPLATRREKGAGSAKLLGGPIIDLCENIPEIVFTVKRLILKPSKRRFDICFSPPYWYFKGREREGTNHYIAESQDCAIL